jgi:hypothetical protein
LSRRLRVLDGRLAVARLAPGDAPPPWASSGGLVSVTRTAEELSVVCAEDAVPAGVRSERGWRALALLGPIPFAETGVLAALLAPLAAARVGIFALSTYDTDLVLVKEADLARAVEALRAAGHEVEGG